MAGKYYFPLPDWRGIVALHWGEDKGASDLFAPIGTPVVSMVSGVVQAVGTTGPGGNNVLIHGDDGLDYYYAHFVAPALVSAGQRVAGGQQIGAVGISGNAAGTDPHLHIGIGYGIASGTGAHGGAGEGFDAVAFLSKVLAGLGPLAPDGPIGQPVSAPGGGGGAGGTPAGSPLHLDLSFLDSAFWGRGLAVVIGAALIIGGLTLLILSSETGQEAVQAGKAEIRGAVALA